MNTPQCVIFDLDGTLYCKRGLGLRLAFRHPRYLRMLVAERYARRLLHGIEFMSPDAFYEKLFSLMAERAHCPVMEAKNWFVNVFMPSQVDILHRHFSPRKWVVSLVMQYQYEGAKTAVLSDYPWVEEKLEALGINKDLFQIRVSSPELGGLKPCKAVGMKLLNMLDAEPQNTLMIGDRKVTDKAFAEACGMNFKLISK